MPNMSSVCQRREYLKETAVFVPPVGAASLVIGLLCQSLLYLLKRLQHSERQRRQLARELAQRKRASCHSKETEFVAAGCVLFRRQPEGTFESQPYCPSCHEILESQPPDALVCSRCVFYAPIGASRVPALLQHLQRSKERPSSRSHP